MGMTPITQIEEGMVLAEDVKDINSRLLISKGERITAENFRILKIWGIPEVKIEGERSAAKKKSSIPGTKITPRQKEEIRKIFSYVDLKHPAIREIYRLSIKYRSDFSRVTKKAENQPITPQNGNLKRDSYLKIDQTRIKLPETPMIITELNSIIDNPYSGADDISTVVQKSPSLSALLLRIVNSAFYNFPEKIDSIPWAVTLIGTKEIVNLALGITIMEEFRDIPKRIVDMPAFIKHSFACGIISRILGAHKNTGQTEQMFISGLLHDIGRLVIYKYFPDQSKNILNTASDLNRPLYQIEREYAGVEHEHVATRLLKKWKLPLGPLDTVAYHHTPSSAQDPIKAGIVHVSDMIVIALGFGTSGEKFIPVFDAAAWDKLQISPNIFETVIQQTIHQLKFLSTFYSG